MQAQTNEPEMKELRRVRDRSKVLEGEYAALQRRYKEHEMRSTSNDLAASSVRASLAQAQQRATEWEERANEHESALSETQAAREDVEDRMAQLAEDHALVKMQLEEKDAEERLAKDRENKLRDQAAVLEARVAQLQLQVNDRSNTRATSTNRTAAAAVSSPPRPDSRTSTIYPSRTVTPTASTIYPSRTVTPTASVVDSRHRTDTPPTSVWDSIHAPSVSVNDWRQRQQPKGRFAVQQQPDWLRQSRVPSPAPSVTRGDDGWWNNE